MVLSGTLHKSRRMLARAFASVSVINLAGPESFSMASQPLTCCHL
jgi:hypothetical protein